MKNLYDDPLVFPFLYNEKRAVCDAVKAVLKHDRRLSLFAIIPPLLKVPSWTRTMGKGPKKICVVVRGSSR